MIRIIFIVVLILFGKLTVAAQPTHDKILFIDTHNDVLSKQILTGADLAREQPDMNFDLVKAKKGGMAAQVFSIWCDETYGPGRAYARANREIDSLYTLAKRNPDKMTLVTSSRGLREAMKSNKLAALIGVEGGHMIEGRIDYIDSLYRRGMRYLTLTWNNSTSWATSARDEVTKKDSLPFTGLTATGKQIVQRLNGLGVMVDVSHVGEQTFYDVMNTSTKPVIASHSSSYTLDHHRRNLKDDQLKALAKNGGVVFVNFYSQFLDSTYGAKEAAFMRMHKRELDSLATAFSDSNNAEIRLFNLYRKETDQFRPPLSILIKHIDYIVKLIGVDHVGIGSDFDGSESFPLQMDDVTDYPLIAVELRKLGYSEADIRKIANGNFMRVLEANEKKN